jgi:hypothetical protein
VFDDESAAAVVLEVAAMDLALRALLLSCILHLTKVW